MTEILDRLRAAIGTGYVLSGKDAAPWSKDWTGKYTFTPMAVLRPANTAEVSAILTLAHETATPVVPVSGNTGLAGGTVADGALMLSLDRLNKIHEIRADGRVAIVEAGVILSAIHDAADAHGLIFPLTFGARGSTMVGGFLSTNAGGVNVVRYGNTRDLVMGIEVVLADGRIMNLMSELHKDNSGLNLRNLVVGAEGQLGIITAAVLKLHPKPRAYATAMVAMPSLEAALKLLNTMQEITGRAVEAFELMSRNYIAGHMKLFPDAREPFEEPHEINIMIEVGALAPRDATPLEDGSVPVVTLLEETLGCMLENGEVLDAVVATNEAQRAEMWARREAAGEVAFGLGKFVNTDVCVPVDMVGTFLEKANARMTAIDPDMMDVCVCHLGDGNVHYTVYPPDYTEAKSDAMTEAVEDVVEELRGSFSAEHGIGVSKLATMRRRKDPVALSVMQSVKQALDPKGILNPGKVIPPVN